MVQRAARGRASESEAEVAERVAAEAANDIAFDELLWEFDVTRVRADVEAARAPGPQSGTDVEAARAPAPRSGADVEAGRAPGPRPGAAPGTTTTAAPRPGRKPRAERVSRPATFARPELRTRWQRFRANIGVRILSWVVLVGGTGALVALAAAQR
jgi:hypothetical protein